MSLCIRVYVCAHGRVRVQWRAGARAALAGARAAAAADAPAARSGGPDLRSLDALIAAHERLPGGAAAAAVTEQPALSALRARAEAWVAASRAAFGRRRGLRGDGERANRRATLSEAAGVLGACAGPALHREGGVYVRSFFWLFYPKRTECRAYNALVRCTHCSGSLLRVLLVSHINLVLCIWYFGLYFVFWTVIRRCGSRDRCRV